MKKPAIHISIEGFDGVGKSTVCKLLAKELNYEFVEKPLHYLFDEDDSYKEYIRIRDKVNACPDRDFTASFYGLGSIYLYYLYKDRNIITDRHLLSNYAWSGTDSNKDIYDLLLQKLGKPYLTVVLYAKEETIKARLKERNKDDADLSKVNKSEEMYRKMRRFCIDNRLNTLWLYTDNVSPTAIVKLIIERLEELSRGEKECFKAFMPAVEAI